MITQDPERHELTAFLNLAPPLATCRVLEIGCGDGRLTRLYAPFAGSVVAIDPDAAAIANFAVDLPPRVEARAVPFDQALLPDDHFDLVLFSWSL